MLRRYTLSVLPTGASIGPSERRGRKKDGRRSSIAFPRKAVSLIGVSRNEFRFHQSGRAGLGCVAIAVAVVMAMLLAGCGDKKKAAASQTAAKVNKDEITVHQINFVLQQQRGLRPEQADAAEQADPGAADRPGTGAAEGRRPQARPRPARGAADSRPPSARSWPAPTWRRSAKAPPSPRPKRSRSTTTTSPPSSRSAASTASRRSPSRPSPSRWTPCATQAERAKNIDDFIEYLKANDFKLRRQPGRARRRAVAAAQPGRVRQDEGRPGHPLPLGQRVQVIVLAGSRSQPVTEEQARPAIEQFLLNERKRKLIEDDVKAMRAAAKIEYVGKFAEAAASRRAAPPRRLHVCGADAGAQPPAPGSTPPTSTRAWASSDDHH